MRFAKLLAVITLASLPATACSARDEHYETFSAEGPETQQQARALATLYRWFYFYETDTPNFEDQYAILHNDVSIAGTVPVQGLAAYKESLQNPYFVFGQNAHHVEDIDFVAVTSTTTEMVVGVLYQGIDKIGAINSYRLRYQIELVEDGAELPKIKRMLIEAVAEAEKVFVATYAKNYALAKEYELKAISCTDR